eukprot:Rmarinus@m.19485
MSSERGAQSDPVIPEFVTKLVSCGYDEIRATNALVASGWKSIDAAVELLEMESPSPNQCPSEAASMPVSADVTPTSTPPTQTQSVPLSLETSQPTDLPTAFRRGNDGRSIPKWVSSASGSRKIIPTGANGSNTSLARTTSCTSSTRSLARTASCGSEITDDDFEIYSDDDNIDFTMPEVPEADEVKKTVPFVCLSAEQLIDAQEAETKEVADVLNVEQAAAGTLLRHYAWDKEKLMAQYFENPEKVCKEAHVELSSSKGKEPVHCSKCPICYEDVSEDAVRIPCGHAFCTDCFAQYAAMKISENNLNINCPMYDCERVVSTSDIKAHVQREQFKKYQRFLAKSFVERNEKVQWCPAVDCNCCIKCNVDVPKCTTPVLCNCGNEFCFVCSEEAHLPASCEDVAAWMKKMQDESETYNWLRVNTKDCPKCSTAIEKNGGCNHMTCRKCSYGFCWMCLEEWSNHNDYYSCNRYTAKAEESESDARASLQRYMFYYDRYMNHEHSLQKTQEFLGSIQEHMESLHNTDKSVMWIDVQYLEDAARIVIQCRKVLRWSYVHAYFLPSGPSRELFENYQQGLENATEQLADAIECNDQNKKLEDIDKAVVLNWSNSAKQRRETLICWDHKSCC